GDQDVGRGYVAVNETGAGRVGVGEPARGLGGEERGGRHRHGLPHRSEARQEAGEVEAGDELERQVIDAADLTEVEYLDDIRVGQRAGDTRLVLKQRDEVRLLAEGREYALHRDGLLESGGAAQDRAEHLGHSARGNALEQHVLAECLGKLGQGVPGRIANVVRGAEKTNREQRTENGNSNVRRGHSFPAFRVPIPIPIPILCSLFVLLLTRRI